ncbi:MAG: 2-succinyl-5-enolpyruvyl-6-hydroxy-3-cyclohexene-1-carboxylic-acid synthase [Actinomycetaceae bacterium]|nr:2-succinyl-5-enolpyruvyl-6-hydroxy-3-cyclohexene-1-carboxylic-acid synthase [Actinomycetaceae bacterium]
MTNPAPSNSTTIAREIIAQLVRDGVRHVILCPGSRSAPFAYALYDAEAAGVLNLHVETDERVAGFVALGCGVAGELAAVVTTSGSAVANLHPAVEEAYYAGVPLIVISADRPQELRGVRANQTTDHRAVLAGSVRYFAELPMDMPKRNRDGIIRRALRSARGTGIGTVSGPVHLNVALREPLMPSGPWETAVEDCRRVPETKATGVATVANNAFPRTVVVNGPSLLPAELDSELFNYVPVLAEPSGILRAHPNAVPAHPLLLRTEIRADIDRVIVVGHPTLTRDITGLLSDSDVEVFFVDEAPTYTDVSGNAQVIAVEELAAYLPGAGSLAADVWLKRWHAATDAVNSVLAAWTAEQDDVICMSVAARALSQLPGKTVVGASSIIRDLNTYGVVPASPVHANRGLAGIDGTISTGIGLALATGTPVRVLLGDLAFIHDATALIPTVLQASIDLDVIVFDDAGGALFATLEYGDGDEDAFERVFRTAKDFDVEAYARAVGVQYLAPKTVGELVEVVENRGHGVRLIHVKLPPQTAGDERAARAERAGRVVAAVRQALEAGS